MAIKVIKQGDLSWINIDKVDDEAIQYLKTHFKFHHLDYEDIQSESQTPKMDVYDKYLFIVLQFPHWRGETKAVVPFELDIFMGDNYLITIQHDKIKEMKNFFYRCMRNRRIKRDWMSGDAGYLLYRLAEALYHNSRPILNNMGRKISALEDDIFSDEQDTKVIKELAIHRRNILSFRRIIDPQRYLMTNISHIRKPFLSDHMSLYYDDLGDYLNKLWVILQQYKDTINGLHVTTESLINQRTNKVISALTVISVALLPLTLLSGIYGMNIDRLPFAHNPLWVWLMFGGMATMIILTIYAMRRKHWL